MLDLIILMFFSYTYAFDHNYPNLMWCEQTPDWFVMNIVFKDTHQISYFEYKAAEGYLYSQGIISMWAQQYSYTKNC